MFIELHTSSAFSFLRGASLPDALIARAAALGYPALALIDADGVYGAPQFYRAAKKAGLKAIVGAELTMGETGRPERDWRLPVLVSSAEGYRNLCRAITRVKLRAAKGEARFTLKDLDGHTRGLVALAGRDALAAEQHGVGGLVDQLVGVFGRDGVWMELQRHLRGDDERANRALLDLASAFRVQVMASNGVRFASSADRPLFDVLTCIHHGVTLDSAGRRLTANAERYLKPQEAMARLFADVPQALAGTEALAERLEFTLANLGYRFPDYPVPSGETQISFLRRIAQVGARDRYRPYYDKARAQIDRELALIEKLELAGYFLIVWDIVNFCRQQRILVQGRGSAANSAVCYALGITAVDPVGMELLFERFLSEERGEWPDIDLDLPSGDRRERVIQYVYERYGRMGAAMTANVITYRGKSAAREVGKVLCIADDEIDRLARLMHQFEWVDPADSFARNLTEAGLDPADPRYQQFGELWQQMQDLPRHLGQHSGGMVVCQGRLDEVVPLEPASMPGRVVVQWDKDDCADLGIVKVDLLGLGMMAALEDALTIINAPAGLRPCGYDSQPHVAGGLQPAGPRVDLAHLPPNDPAVYAMLQRADTVGVFQVESRAQMATLPRMRPEHFYDIVVEVAIIRPGPIVGNMVHPYLRRRRGEEPVTYDHPLLEPVLKRTLGVPLFQEQLLRMAMVVGNFSGGEAEELRRAMGFKRSMQRMAAIEARLRSGMAANGITGEAADRIVKSISSFALYGFPESHAASFALIVYASAFLKAHYPAAFYAALLNNQPMGFYHPATLVKDAQRHGVQFAPVDVTTSQWESVVQPDGVVRLGLRCVKGLRKESAERIVKGSTALQGYCSIDDLARRAALSREELRVLAEVGALSAIGGDRRTALWQAERGPDIDLPQIEDSEIADPNSQITRKPDNQIHGPLKQMSLLERVAADYSGTGLTIGPHPMAIARASLAPRGVLRATDLARIRPGRRVRVAGAVITRQRPGTAKGFVFLSLEDETGIANAIVTPDVFAAYKRVIVDHPYLIVEGVLQNQDGSIAVKVERADVLHHAGPEVESHDFH
ncbi:MAG: DNA polymerase III subunit alpha [Acidobacteria bacterium]|nr:MAG: DNA polymerase III subunit alpha [Acidobacteriota bacterium]